MRIEYAGSLYATKRETQLASIHDYFTACGTDAVKDVLDSLDSVGSETLELMESGWCIPYARDWDFSDYQELVYAWIGEVSS